jgi:hypothetical protein
VRLEGNFVGPLLFKPEDAPRYAPGFLAVVVTSAVSAILAIVYRLICVWENKKRDRTGTTEAFEHAYEDDLTDKMVRGVFLNRFLSRHLKLLRSVADLDCLLSQNPQFRYTL